MDSMDLDSNSDYSDLTNAVSIKIVTLRDMIVRIKEASTLAPVRRAQILSALRTLARVLAVEPGDIVVSPAALRARLENVTPMAVGLTQPRWAAIRSLLLPRS